MRILTFFFIVFCSAHLFSQETELTTNKSFTILVSSKSYSTALKKAQKAANQLQVPMDLRGLSKDEENGLNSTAVCGCGEKHGYLPRGRYDDGKYISIEYSSAYEGFTEGYYIVIMESGDRASLEGNLPKAKEVFKDAYIKDSSVYMGCMH